MASRGGTITTDNQTKEDLNGMKLYMALAVWMFAAPAWATCGVGHPERQRRIPRRPPGLCTRCKPGGFRKESDE